MITEAQRLARRSCIGSSDSPALCGVDQYRSLYDLWADKTGKLEERPPSEDAERGVALEPYVLSMFERRMNVRLVRDIELCAPGIFGANLDAAIATANSLSDRIGFISAGVEAKTTVDDEGWGEEIEDVPLRVLVQVQHQMMVGGYTLTYIPVLIPKFKRFHFEIYQILRHDSLIAQIRERGEWFWEKHVKTDIPPPATLPHLETLKRWRREPKSIIQLDDEAAKLWVNMELAKAERKKWDKTVEQFQIELLTKLGDAEAGELPDGARLTYLSQNGARQTDFDLLQMRLRERGCEDLYNEFITRPTFRVLRHQKAKTKSQP